MSPQSGAALALPVHWKRAPDPLGMRPGQRRSIPDHGNFELRKTGQCWKAPACAVLLPAAGAVRAAGSRGLSRRALAVASIGLSVGGGTAVGHYYGLAGQPTF